MLVLAQVFVDEHQMIGVEPDHLGFPRLAPRCDVGRSCSAAWTTFF